MPDDLTPAQEEAVRRLLAEARETGPMPADVADRLDAVLADLAGTTSPTASISPETASETVAAPTPGAAPATVVLLRRRRWPQVVLAAAAVTAIGFGTVQVLDRDGGLGDDSTTQSGAGAGELEVAEQHTLDADRAPADATAPPPAEADAPEEKQLAGRRDRNAVVTLAGLDGALQAQGLRPVGRLRAADPRNARGAAQKRSTANGYDDGFTTSAAVASWTCGPLYAVPEGSTYSSVKRPRTFVVAHPPVNGIRLVEVYDCAGDEPRRSSAVVTLQPSE